MKSAAPWALALCALCTLAGCSRPKDDQSAQAAAPPPPSAPGLSAAISALPTPVPSAAALPTPEDEEEDSAHRITEKNLESELDRLEREIQAE